MFSHITMNWRGRPLVTHDVIVNLIGSTKTASGLRVSAPRQAEVSTSVPVSDEEMVAITRARHKFYGDWNYTIKP